MIYDLGCEVVIFDSFFCIGSPYYDGPADGIGRVKTEVTPDLDLEEFDILVNCLPYYLNSKVLEIIKKNPIHYFDLSEDVFYTQTFDHGKYPRVFVPHCGLAPGIINVVASSEIKSHGLPRSVLMQVGALPIDVPDNALKYCTTWSIDGLINEYLNPVMVIRDFKETTVEPLKDRRYIDGDHCSFNTSGGIGTMAETFAGKVSEMSYQSIRYHGHLEEIEHLLYDLNLRYRQDLLLEIIRYVCPPTTDDKVMMRVEIDDELKWEKTILPSNGMTAIQKATASGVVTMIEVMLNREFDVRGWVKQEDVRLSEILETKFGKCFQ